MQFGPRIDNKWEEAISSEQCSRVGMLKADVVCADWSLLFLNDG